MKDSIDVQSEIWFQPHSGEPFYFDRDDEPFLSIQDIAMALSNLPRFTGHSATGYKVAQHSLLVAALCPIEYAKEALLHDATEAITGDMSTPFKRWLGPSIKEVEDRLHRRVARTYGLPETISKVVKRADVAAMMVEKRDLLAHPNIDWGDLGEPITDPRLLKRLEAWGTYASQSLFLDAFYSFEHGDRERWEQIKDVVLNSGRYRF
jgi:hypothetical protein